MQPIILIGSFVICYEYGGKFKNVGRNHSLKDLWAARGFGVRNAKGLLNNYVINIKRMEVFIFW